MSKAGKLLIESAKEALAFAEGTAQSSDYRVTIPDEINVKRICAECNHVSKSRRDSRKQKT